MIATDFIYDGIRLTDLGYMICQFDEGSGFQMSSAGSELTFSKVAQNNGRNHLLAGVSYDSCFETYISICKPDGGTFSTEEYAYLMRWLNRPDFHDLYIGFEPDRDSTKNVTNEGDGTSLDIVVNNSATTVYYGVSSDSSTLPETWTETVPVASPNKHIWTIEVSTEDASGDSTAQLYAKQQVEYGDYDAIHFRGTFNLDKVEFHGRIVGFKMKFTSDGPFGYAEPTTISFNVDSTSAYTLTDTSDECGYIYPDQLEITCNGDGTLTITNSVESRQTTIKNMTSGEVLSFDGTVSSISTTLASHSVMDDFNYTFFRVANTHDTSDNIISSTLPCSITLTYTPRRKVVF